MNELEKLRVLLPHWIEHNQEHTTEFQKWVERTLAGGEEQAARRLGEAVRSMELATQSLAMALETLGGPVSGHVDH